MPTAAADTQAILARYPLQDREGDRYGTLYDIFGSMVIDLRKVGTTSIDTYVTLGK